MKKFRIVLLGVLISSSINMYDQDALAQESVDCARCDKVLNLTEREFLCLKERLPKMVNSKTKYVFFNLAENKCIDTKNDTVRGSTTKIPKISSSAPKVYRIPRVQMQCLAEKIDGIGTKEKNYTIDLVSLCST